VRIERLELIAFGSLKGVSLEFSSEEPCLHLVYGANEAGKSTALRAISGLFYGIPENTPDTHSIRGAELRVGALLRDARGRQLQVVRRKGRKDTLRAPDGTALPGAEASWLCAGLAEHTFHALFGLSFASLQAGAEELLGTAGDLGQSLFSAALGGASVRAQIKALREEADALFRPRGRNQPLNEALAQLEQARRRVREQAMQAGAFREQQAAIEAAEADAARLQRVYFARRSELSRLERARRVLPLLAKRSELQRELAELADAPRLPSDAPERRRQVESARREATLRLEHVQADALELEREHAALPSPSPLEQLEASAIDDLRDRLGAYRRSLLELPRRREALARARQEVDRSLARLGLRPARPGEAALPDTHSLQELEPLRVPKALEVRAREQLRALDALQREAAELARATQQRRAELQRQRRQLAQLWAASEEPGNQLPLLTRYVLPSDQACEECERAFAELARAADALAGKREAAAQAREQNRLELEALALAGAPPTEAELQQLRAERAESWTELRAALREANSKKQRQLLEKAIEQSEQADALADRLRREASRVAEHARLRAEELSIARSCERLAAESTALEQRRAERSAAWRALFRKAAIPERPPREVRALLVEQRAIEARCDELERELSGLERDERERAARERSARIAFRELAARLQVSEQTGAAELDASLETRSELFLRADAAAALERELAELEQELGAFEQSARALCERQLPDSAGQPIHQAAEQLVRAHQSACSALERRQQLEAALAARRAELTRAQSALDRAERDLDELLRAGGAQDLSQLAAAELRSERARALDAALAQLQAELSAAADGANPDAVLDDVPGTLDEVRAQLGACAEALEELDHERQRVAHTLASCRAGLEHLRESHGSGDAALEAAGHLESVRGLAERYIKVRLAGSVLKREVDRYRERHRGGILRSAGALFEQLTLGNFSGLDVDYGAADEPLLSCVRRDGSRIGIEGLSTGTRDQLFLALRLASIEHLSSRHELLPLILDDAFVHFDDERARAALKVLGAFSRTTQVLFFTHHRRLVELASQALPGQQLRVHRLGEGPLWTPVVYS
jgi:uncharacterized protein YhaN